MSTINELTTLAYIKASMAIDRAVASLHDIKDDERGSSELVVTLILIGIAAAALIIFKDQLLGNESKGIKGWLPTIVDKIGDIFNDNSDSGFKFFANRF